MILFWAPLAAASAHVVEEFVFPGGFARWYRAYRPEIAESVTPRFLVAINAALLFGCFAVGVDQNASFGPAFFLAMTALLAENGLFHLAATIRTRRYSPGVITGVALYVPLAAYGSFALVSSGHVSPAIAAVAAAAGASYQFLSVANHRRRARYARERSLV